MAEKRLIDKNVLLDALEQWRNDDPYRKLRWPRERWVRAVGIYSLETVVKNMKTVDAVEVVRCRDCKHYHAAIGWCDKLSFFQTSDGEPCSPSESREWKKFEENDFCSCGERRADEKINI